MMKRWQSRPGKPGFFLSTGVLLNSNGPKEAHRRGAFGRYYSGSYPRVFITLLWQMGSFFGLQMAANEPSLPITTLMGPATLPFPRSRRFQRGSPDL